MANTNDPTDDKKTDTTSTKTTTTQPKPASGSDSTAQTIKLQTEATKPVDPKTEAGEAKVMQEPKTDDAKSASGDVADSDAVKALIAENKDGETIAKAPTAGNETRTVTVEEAMQAVAVGRPIPGVDLKPGDRPDIQVTTREDVLRMHAKMGDDIANGSVTKKGGDLMAEGEVRGIHPRTRVVRVEGEAKKAAEEARKL